MPTFHYVLTWQKGQSISLDPLTAAAAAAVKSLQSCLTLCDPIDGSPTLAGGFLSTVPPEKSQFIIKC